MILVTGAGGQLGTAFRRLLGTRAIYTTRAELDLRDTHGVARHIAALEPDMVINCAAYTAVDDAESQRDIAFAVNGTAVGAMAMATSDLGIPFVTLSTDYVFDGTATDPYVESSRTSPINTYGASKLAGERAAFEANPDALVVRTSWVLSGTHPNFVSTMITLARERELRVVDDQRGNPTIAEDLARAILAAVDVGATGILHLTNHGPTTWYRLAREAVALAGGDPERITPCGTVDYPTPARRPANSVLVSERLGGLGLDPLPPYSTSLARIVGELHNNGIV